MGLFDRVESRLERAVNGAFARAFKSEVEPVEIAAAIRRAMDDRAAVVGQGRTIVPNRFSIELSDTDYDRLASMEDALKDELVAAAEEHAESQRYSLNGPFEVELAAEEDLETGVFRMRTATSKRQAREPVAAQPPRARTPQERQPASDDHDIDRDRDHDSDREFDVDGDGTSEPALREQAPRRSVRAAVPPPLPVEPFAPSVQGSTRPQPTARGYGNAADRPWLEIDGERYPLLGAITVLGRDDSADIMLDDPGVSRQHSELRVTTDGPHLVTTIRDLHSTNGTFVEGNRISSEHLTDGNRLTVGRTSIVYRVRRR